MFVLEDRMAIVGERGRKFKGEFGLFIHVPHFASREE